MLFNASYTGEQEHWQRYPQQEQGDPGTHLGVVELAGALLRLRSGSGAADECLLADSGVCRRRGGCADAGLLAGSGRRKGGGGHLPEQPLAGNSRSGSGGAGGDHRAERWSSLSRRGSVRCRGRHADDGLLAGSGGAWGGGGDRRDEGRGRRKAAPRGQLHLQYRQVRAALDEETKLMLDNIASCAVRMTTDYSLAA